MNRLTRYIENELDRNSLLFAQAESGLSASLDFINLVLRDKSLVTLSEEEQKYILKIRESYRSLCVLTNQMQTEIRKYKEAYCELILDKDD